MCMYIVMYNHSRSAAHIYPVVPHPPPQPQRSATPTLATNSHPEPKKFCVEVLHMV